MRAGSRAAELAAIHAQVIVALQMSDHVLFMLLVDIVVIVAVARLGGEVAARLGIPQVIGEILAGIALGPSLFGWLWPHGFSILFPLQPAVRVPLEFVGWIGVVFLVINAGLETRLGVLQAAGKAVFAGWIGGFFVPFASGFALGLMIPSSFAGEGVSRLVFALFVATAISISAIPVIARILLDLNLLKTRMGMVVMSTALADDTVGWIILAGVLGLAAHGTLNGSEMAWTLGLVALFLAFAATAGQWLVRKGMRLMKRATVPHAQTTFILLVVLACGAITQLLEVHLVLGSFVAAVLITRSRGKDQAAIEAIGGVGSALFVPLFFGLAGLKVDLTSIDGAALPVMFAAIAVACLSKLVGGGLGAYLGGLTRWEAFAVGAGRNARGAMELVIATLGLSTGIIGLPMYSIIIVIAVVTTLMAAPLLKYAIHRSEAESLAASRATVEVA